MAVQTQPVLNVVQAPLGRPATDAAAVEDLQFFGGRTLARLEWTHVYLGRWASSDRKHLDTAVPAALHDRGLSAVLHQYFPGKRVSSVFRGSQPGPVSPARIDKRMLERMVTTLALPGVAVLLLPPGVVLVERDGVTSEHGLAGYHGSVGGHYYAVAVYSEGTNGIVAFDEPWKNVCATVYHELQEARTDPDVEEAIRTGDSKHLGWYSPHGGEIADIPIEILPLDEVMREVPLADGSGTVPVQSLWSNEASAAVFS